MDMGCEHEIRERAYAIWIDAGMIDGEAEHHWFRAEAALRKEAAVKAAAETTVKPAAKPAKGKTAVKATAASQPARGAAKSAGTAGRKARSAGAAALEVGA